MEEHEIARFVQVSCNDVHCCALDEKGHPTCWGEEDVYGAKVPPREQTVLADAGGDSAQVGEGEAFYGFNEVEGGAESLPDTAMKVPFKQISVGPSTTCGIRYDTSDLMCWGNLESLYMTEASLTG